MREEAARAGTGLNEALAEFGASKRPPIRRVRVLQTDRSVRIVAHGRGFRKAYSAGDNHRVEIYEAPDGRWRGEGISVFDANRPGFEPEWRRKHPEARLAMKVHKGDLVEADFGAGRNLYRVCMLDAAAGRLKLAPDHEAGSLGERHADNSDPFRYEMKSYSSLKRALARRVRVDPIGRVAPVAEES